MSEAAWKEVFPYESRWYETRDGYRVHYIDQGSGIPVVIVAGFLGWAFYFRRLIRVLLEQRYRVIVVDHLGFGLSDKPDRYEYSLEKHLTHLTKFLSVDLKLPRFHLIAHGHGAPVAMGYAVQHHERLRRLILLSPILFPGMPFMEAPWLLRVPGLWRLFAYHTKLFMRLQLALGIRQGSLNKLEKSAFLTPYRNCRGRHPWQMLFARYREKPSNPSYALLNEISLRLQLLSRKAILCLGGERDGAYFPENGERLQHVLPQSLVLNFPKAGHYLLEDCPEEAIPIICRFLN